MQKSIREENVFRVFARLKVVADCLGKTMPTPV
jgi:hypothetical protein